MLQVKALVAVGRDRYQSRSSTFVTDAVAGTIAAISGARVGGIYNIAGSRRSTVQCNAGAQLTIRPTLIVGKEKRLVLDHRTAHRAAKNVPAQRRRLVRKKIPRVQLIVANEVEQRAVVVVSTWFGRYVDLCRLAAELGLGAAMPTALEHDVRTIDHDPSWLPAATCRPVSTTPAGAGEARRAGGGRRNAAPRRL